MEEEKIMQILRTHLALQTEAVHPDHVSSAEAKQPGSRAGGLVRRRGLSGVRGSSLPFQAVCVTPLSQQRALREPTCPYTCQWVIQWLWRSIDYASNLQVCATFNT